MLMHTNVAVASTGTSPGAQQRTVRQQRPTDRPLRVLTLDPGSQDGARRGAGGLLRHRCAAAVVPRPAVGR